MRAIETWLAENGREGRKMMLMALRVHDPSFSPQRLSNYIRKKRTPDYSTAQIMSGVTGIPVEQIPYRLINKPDNGK